MPQNTQLDSVEFDKINFPYDRITSELSEEPRIRAGENCFVTSGGKLAKRPGTLEVANFTSTLRIDRMWNYETMEASPKVFLLASMHNPATGYWEMYYNRPDTLTGWVQITNVRSVNLSTSPHECCVSRGLAYIRAIPHVSTSEKYGTVIFDGTDLSVKLWGLPVPTTPARIVGDIGFQNVALSASDTTITLRSAYSIFPQVTVGNVLQIEREQVVVVGITTPNTVFTVSRGYNGTTASPHPQNTIVLFRHDAGNIFGTWSPSYTAVTVSEGWRYSYAYKSSTGHISARAPMEISPDNAPSFTGPFTNLCPELYIPGNADTTNIPEIVIYRTTDGGGTFYELETIPNTGAGNIIYSDNQVVTSAGNAPLPDDQLSTNSEADKITSCSPPPTVIAPQEIGVDTPVKGTPIVSFQSRLWYAIGNILFFSGQEEIKNGIPEESWPSGLSGNFFRLQHPVYNLIATTRALYIFTAQNTLILTGNNRETFNIRPLYEELGVPPNQPRAVAKFGDKVAYLTHDLRVAVTDGEDEVEIISDPLYTDLVDQLTAHSSMEAEFRYWGDLEKDWLVISVHKKDDPTDSKTWIFDIRKTKELKKYFWFPPWTIPSVAAYSGRITEGTSQRRLCFYIFNPATPYGRLVRLDSMNGVTSSRDVTVGSGAGAGVTGIDWYADVHLHKVPPGNHVNSLRSPGLVPNVLYLSLERSQISGDEDPDVYHFFDDAWTEAVPSLPPQEPARRTQSKGYKTLQCQVNQVAYRYSFRVKKANSVKPMELQSYAIVYSPDSGA